MSSFIQAAWIVFSISMADKRLKKQEILQKFIIKADYGTAGAFPYGLGAVVVLSEVSCESFDDDRWTVFGIHRNGIHPKHGERKLLELLRRISGTAQKIDVQLTQNFSPCNMDYEENGAKCAQKIVDYLKEMEKNKKEIKISITFANFYRTERYTGNGEDKAQKNRKGLKLLDDNGVTLNLLRGEEEWKRLLNNEQFVCLCEKERKECLKEAMSEAREKREDRDYDLLESYLMKLGEASLKALTLEEKTKIQDQQ